MSLLDLKLLIAASFALLLAYPVLAADEYNTTSGVTTTGYKLGMHGMDPVELSTRRALSEGIANHTVVHDGVAYYFISAATAAKFEASPDRYLPQFGGFCAYAIALGKKFDGDPKYADIVDGKLYLFVNAEIYDTYRKDAAAIIANAHQKWPEIKSTAVDDL